MPPMWSREVLIRVRASSVNLWDLCLARGNGRFPVMLGHDLAGVVTEIGPAVRRFKRGDEVFGFVDRTTREEGTLADYVAVAEDDCIARKPSSVDFAAAASVPMAALTAAAAVDALEVSHGTRLLIVGAHGGVGSFAVQIATARGWQVIATGMPEDHEYLRGLGAVSTLDRRSDLVAAVAELHPDGIDALLDLMHGESGFNGLAGSLRPGGAAISVLGAAGGEERDMIEAVNVSPSLAAKRLEEIAKLIDAGKLEVPVHRTYRLDEVAEALEHFSTNHVLGKLAIAID